ncbi:MAG: aldehyde dehydrogenase [Flexilinea sp.]
MYAIINGEKCFANDDNKIEVINPVNGEVIDTVPNCSQKDVDEALKTAQKGKEIWGHATLAARVQAMYRMSELLLENKVKIATVEQKETGRPYHRCLHDIDGAAYTYRAFGEKAAHECGLVMPRSEVGMENDLVYTTREPLGVVVCIIPFNHPNHLYSFKIAAALVTGNAVIIKPPSEAPLQLIMMTELLYESGIPEEAAQIVTGYGDSLGNMLIDTPLIDAVSFTGSTEVGKHIVEIGAKYLHRTSLELGGNDALIICKDADLDYAADEACIARLRHSGQVCCSAKRFLVDNSVKEVFIEKLIFRIEKLAAHTDSFDEQTVMSYMISEKAAIKVQDQIQHTISQGAEIIYGNQRFGALMMPTVLTNVTRNMDIAKDLEVFGPVYPIIGFETLDEAIEIANNTVYGLMGGIITKDIHQAVKTASRMKCGGVVLNGHGFYRSVEMPFGGYKQSGLGREGVFSGLDQMTQNKTIILKDIY